MAMKIGHLAAGLELIALSCARRRAEGLAERAV